MTLETEDARDNACRGVDHSKLENCQTWEWACAVYDPSGRYLCGLPKGHTGQHRACEVMVHNVALWPNEKETKE